MTSQQKAWRKYYAKNREKLNKDRRERAKVEYPLQKETIKQRVQRYRDELKRQTLARYSKGNEPSCNHCGFSDIRALCLDHINDNGGNDRRRTMGRNVGGSGSRFYGYLRKRGYPDGYQTLCSNCNLIKEINRKRNGTKQ